MKTEKHSSFFRSTKRLFEIFVLFFIAAFVFFDWPEMREAFVSRSVSRMASGEEKVILRQALGLSFPEAKEALGETSPPLSPSPEVLPSPDPLSESSKEAAGEGFLEIPKLDIRAPLVFIDGFDEASFQQGLKKGVVFYPDSVLPGQEGQTIILGHSAPVGYPRINYDWVFSRLNELEQGDEIFVHFNESLYQYQVREKSFLQKGEEITPKILTNYSNMLILVSCWPPGRDKDRIVIQAF